MSKVITLRLKDSLYRRLRQLAEEENRSLSNFVETALMKYLEEYQYVDLWEMKEIEGDEELMESIRKGLGEAKQKKGRFVE